MITLDEDFLYRNARQYNINFSLPLRLQKRQLLKSFGFPQNDLLVACSVFDQKRIKRLFIEYSRKGFPFLILVSEKPSMTVVPPLFTIKGRDEIVWRNDRNEKKNISYAELMDILSGYQPSTWLEFSNYIWGSSTIAGRIACINLGEQIIELQVGVIPSQLLLLDDRRLPAFDGSLNDFNLRFDDYLQNITRLQNMGYGTLPFNTVREIVQSIGIKHRLGLQKFEKIAALPTLEFGIIENSGYIFIDIDWPSQWKEFKDERPRNFHARC